MIAGEPYFIHQSKKVEAIEKDCEAGGGGGGKILSNDLTKANIESSAIPLNNHSFWCFVLRCK